MSMMPFKDITLSWGDEEFVIPANKVMGAINQVEDFITMKELLDMAKPNGKLKFGQLSNAFHSMLNYAGCKVAPEEVYAGMFQHDKTKSAAFTSIEILLSLMIPTTDIQKKIAGSGSTSQGNVTALPGTEPSQQRTKRR